MHDFARIGNAPELDPGDVLEEHLPALFRIRSDDDVLELFYGFEAPGDVELIGDPIASAFGADGARRTREILRFDRRPHILGREPEPRETQGIKPDSHRAPAVRHEFRGRHAFHAGERVLQRIVHVVDEVGLRELRAVRHEGDHAEIVVASLFNANPASRDF